MIDSQLSINPSNQALFDLEEITNLRRFLHTYPEVSGFEENTARVIHEFLLSCNPSKIVTDMGGNGILATWDSELPGKTMLFRAELDALPIKEINTFAHASSHRGVSHSCGHDGHSAILCGLAQVLGKNPPINGKIHLLFQPAEENGKGARSVLADHKFASINPDYIFALHNLPGYDKHQIIIREGSFTAAVNSIIIDLDGKTSHAAEPEHGINPALAVSEIINEVLKLDNNNLDSPNFSVVTPVYVEMGEKAYGISAGKASVHFTLRCWDTNSLRNLEKNVEIISKEIAEKNNLKVEFTYTESFFANQNERECVQLVQKAAADAELTLVWREYPFKWGEDFGLFTTNYKGCMFGLGAGKETPALHNPDYDFPDDLIETGVNMFLGIIYQLTIKG